MATPVSGNRGSWLSSFTDSIADGLLNQITLYQTACSALGSEAYHVLIDFFRTCFALTPEDNAAQARDKIATILQAIGAPTEPIVPVVENLLGFAEKELHSEHLDPEQLKRQLFLAMKEICQCQCRQHPVLLVVEDFQWADAASVELLRSLVDRVADHPLLLLLVARPTAQIGVIYSAKVDSTVHPSPTVDCGGQRSSLRGIDGSVGLALPATPARFADSPRRWESLLSGRSGSLTHRHRYSRQKTPEGTRFSGDVTNLEIPTTVQGVVLLSLR